MPVPKTSKNKRETTDIRLRQKFSCPECGVGIILNFPHHTCSPVAGWNASSKQKALAEIREAFKPQPKTRSRKGVAAA
jgi:hypothetical protein